MKKKSILQKIRDEASPYDEIVEKIVSTIREAELGNHCLELKVTKYQMDVLKRTTRKNINSFVGPYGIIALKVKDEKEITK